MPVALRGTDREGDERQTTGSVPVALRGIDREGDERQTTGPVPVAEIPPSRCVDQKGKKRRLRCRKISGDHRPKVS